MKLDTIGGVIEAAGLAITNTAKDPEVGKRMGLYGFPPKRMLEGENLHTLVRELQMGKMNYYDTHWQIVHRIAQEMEAVRPVFMEHVTIARFAFRNETVVLHALNIKKISPQKWGWVKQADTFYSKLMPYAGQMAVHGVTEEVLVQTKASVEALLALRQDRLYKKGEAEDSTENRNQAIKMLRQWVREFRAAARLALKDKPQKLEAFGISVRTLQKL